MSRVPDRPLTGPSGLTRPAPPSRFVNLLPYAAVLLPLAMLVTGGIISWQGVWRHAQEDLQRTADAGADYADRVLSGYGIAAGRVNDMLRGLTDQQIRAREPALHRELAQLVAEIPQAQAAFVLDRDGVPLVSANLFPVPNNRAVAADRDFFQAFTAPDAPELHVSAVHRSRFDERPFFAIARARRDTGNGFPEGRFDGVVTISVEPLRLAAGMRRVLGDEDATALIREDGVVLAQSTAEEQPRPPLPANSPILHAIATGQTWLQAASPTTGEAEVIALRHLSGFPLVIGASRSRAVIIGQWWGTLLPFLLVGTPMTLALLGLSLQVRRDQRRLTAANTGLTSALVESEAWLRRIQRIGRVGGFEIDLMTDVNRRSAEYMALQGKDARAATEQHEDWVARLHPEDRDRALAGFLEAVASPGDFTSYGQEYRIVTPDGEVRWTAARAEIERDPAGRALRMVGAHLDITTLKQTEAALAESEARFRQIAEAIDDIFYVAEPATERLLYLSPAWTRVTGHPPPPTPAPIEAWLAAVHPEDREAVRAAKHAGPHDMEYRIRHADGGPRRLHDRAFAVPNTPGAETGVGHLAGVARDVTEERRTSEAQTLLAAEVDHRAKNVLAVVQSVIRLTRAESVPEFANAIEGRVAALARAHSLLAKGRWSGTGLAGLVEAELSALGVDDRIRANGPAVTLIADAVQPMAMLLHELATNAAKYGALSGEGGDIDLNWVLSPQGRLRLTWAENGGPALTGPPIGRGFGSTLIEATASGQLKGSIERDWSHLGLRAVITIDASMVQPAAATGPAPRRLPPAATTGPAWLRDRQILIAEDETLIALELRDAVEELGCRVLGPAYTLDQARALMTEDAAIDAAVLDVNLGGQEIFPVAEILRGRGVPIIFTTGYSRLPEEKTRGAPVLRKPLARGELAAALTALLQDSP